MVLDPGTDVPTIRATNQHGDAVQPGFEEPTVLYFYPADNTPGCTTEANQFEAHAERFIEAGVELYGVSTDSVESHRDFAEATDISFDLLADPDGRLSEAFDVPLVDGRAQRTTYVIAREQVVAVYERVGPDGHAASVFEDLVDTGLVRAE
ncbi:peroxiredoxin [Haloarcula taiwanensis]|uniref:thioredoxin-dependent peroxiredoxin n=1 Tax=Haloarcula taiwanensis TaxID=1932004 RepID=A0A2H4ZUM3_9EURY|nr:MULTISPECIES: peroxiredoxin [Haloarcula]AUG46167.1 peroxiredoxin [Haloarcula taiwanensis]RLM40298.1 peroxiredoxin [Haloarcula sp. Atlit-120R]RLM48327.1 peroxiredoxin [Haloarcula sp. Atlit-47R]RLM96715.1 peroxiredoxin [Haloarcula sp. Atlit-7R]